MSKLLPLIDIEESFPFQFDFTKALAGAQISGTPEVEILEWTHQDEDPERLLDGPAEVVSPFVTQWLTPDVDAQGKTYHVRCVIATNESPPRSITLACDVPVGYF